MHNSPSKTITLNTTFVLYLFVGSMTPESPPEFRRSRTVPLGRSPSSNAIDGHSGSSSSRMVNRSLGSSLAHTSTGSATSAATAARGFSAVTSMQVASTGAVVSGTDDGTVRIWDLSKVSTSNGNGSSGNGSGGNGSAVNSGSQSSSGTNHSPTAVLRGHVGKVTKIVLETAGPGRGLGGGCGGSSGGGSSGGDWTGRFVTAGADHSVHK